MDNYREEIVIKHNRAGNNILYALLCIIMVLSGAMALLYISQITFSQNILMTIVFTVVYGGIAFLIWWKKDMLRLEYEYTFTNGQMDFAQVFNNKKRKNLGTMNLKNVEALGLVNSGSFNRYINMKGIKRDNWFVNRDAQLFYFYFSKDSVKRIIIIEVSDEMLALIKRYAAPGAYQVN